MLTRQEVNELLGKNIRKDTYIIMDWISNGKSYQQCCKYINNHREELFVKGEIKDRDIKAMELGVNLNVTLKVS